MNLSKLLVKTKQIWPKSIATNKNRLRTGGEKWAPFTVGWIYGS
ncbi:MAG: hypothetical protein ACFFDT_06190 [Candidatus Hodarchaeota archaeon]